MRQVDDKKRGKDKMKISTGITIVLLHTLIKLGGAAALRNTVLDINGMRFMITKYVFFFTKYVEHIYNQGMGLSATCVTSRTTTLASVSTLRTHIDDDYT